MPFYTDCINAFRTLQLPPQDLADLRFCPGSKPAAVQQWLDNLPLTQARTVSAHFYQALPELARLKTSPQNRLALLDILWEPLHYCLQGLSRDFLNQPLILPEAAHKAATLAQALQRHCSRGWLVTLHDLLGDEPPATADRPLIAFALHRALHSHASLMLRSWQLYIPVHHELWREVHLLYRLAEVLDLARQVVPPRQDEAPLTDTIEQLYGRLLLLASARPNQLRQDELLQVWRALEVLAPGIRLQPFDPANTSSLFVCDIGGNQPPGYKSRLTGQPSPHWRELEMADINQLLAEAAQGNLRDGQQNPLLRLRPPLSTSLLKHLHQAWNVMARRRSDRQSAEGLVSVTIGLSNLHYYLAGKQPFDIFLEQNSRIDNRNNSDFRQRGIQLKTSAESKVVDPWSQALDVVPMSGSGTLPATTRVDNAIKAHQKQEYQGQHRIYEVPLIDSSEGGLCLEWQGEIPAQVRAGELLGLQDPGAENWRIGVIRWVQQTPGATQLGIQILAPMARPVALAGIHKTGEFSEYLRALQLPAIKSASQPGTLITNAVSFRENQKVRLYVQEGSETGKTHSLQLLNRIFATGAVGQFTFRAIADMSPEGHSPR